jgi:uncharacterized damage-inducible protein DinB
MSLDTTERNRIVAEVNRTWADLTRKLESFSENELNIPNVIGIWSLKDLIGHLETWDRIAIHKINYAEQGEHRPWWQLEESSYDNIDQFNEADADNNRHKSIPQLWNELHRTHAELVERLETSTAYTDELVEVDTYGHYQDHLNDIEAWESARKESDMAGPR